MRGIFCAGVLDAFMEAEFDPFDLYIGVSSGALNLSSHLAGQYQRNYRVITRYGVRPEFVSLGKFLRGGNLMDLDWMFDICEREDPVDVEAAARRLGSKNFLMVATDLQSGQPAYLQPRPHNWTQCALASCALPLVFRTRVWIEGKRYMDGGFSDPIPVREAYKRGARRIVVVRTREFDYQKHPNIMTWVNAWAFRAHPAFRACILNHAHTYNQALRFIAHPPEGVEMIHIAPQQPLASKRTTRDLQALEKDYRLGLELGREALASFPFPKAHWQQGS